jgi:hypothetical protein
LKNPKKLNSIHVSYYFTITYWKAPRYGTTVDSLFERDHIETQEENTCFLGFVGRGLLAGAVHGDVFTSPPTDQALPLFHYLHKAGCGEKQSKETTTNV